MDTSLDFLSRARNAFKELRHPGMHDEPPINHENASVVEGDERRHSLNLPVPPTDPSVALTQFRLLVGIYQDKSFAPPRGWMMGRRPQASVQHRPAPNLGLYTTICEKEITTKRNYKQFSKLVNFCLGAQLIVAAALTAIGAAGGNRSAVTVFGAINTVIAGFLTFLKGSGLPNRLKYFQHEWGRVREYIEQKERDFMFGVPGMDVQTEVETIRQMYEAVKADVQTNTPDRFVSAQQLNQQMQKSFAEAKQNAAGHGVQKPQPSLSADSLNGRYINEKEFEVNATVNKAQGAAQGMFGKFGHLKDVLGDKVKDLGQLEKEIESSGRQAYQDGRQGLSEKHEQLHGQLHDVANLGKDIQTNAQAAAAEQAQQITQRTRDAQAALAQSTDAVRTAALAQRDNVVNAAGQYAEAGRNAAAAQRDNAYNTIGQYADSATAAVNARANAAHDAIGQSSNAATAHIAAQRDATHTALYGHDQSSPPPPPPPTS